MIGNKQLRAWATEYEGTGEEITIPEREGLPRELTAKQGTFTMPNAFVAEVPDVTFLGSIGVGYHNSDIILESGFCGRIDCLSRNSRYLNEIDNAGTYTPVTYDRILPLNGVWSGEYFHWVLEFFPKLMWIEGLREKNKPLVLIHGAPREFQTEMLDLAGFGYRAEMSYPSYKAVKAFIPTTPRWKGYTSPSAVRWVVNTLTENIPPVDGGPTRFYISRGDDQKARRVVNETEIILVLREHDFYVIDPGTFTVAEQVALFQNAEVIIGPHGGGLTNMIYAEKPIVFEFFPPSYINPCMYTLAVSLGYGYDCIVADLHEREDLVIDPELLDEKLGEICA